VKFIPAVFLRAFIKVASRSVHMARRYGVIGVTAVGMFGSSGVWFIPLSGATVTVTVGGIIERITQTGQAFEKREHLCLTVTFNHDIVDGAPAARFLKRLAEMLESMDFIKEALSCAKTV
jgi:pyruvate/2-oxoglutarate dehydrogenase complex dihydrolipoamide acyltransferase (E2) component